MANKRMFSVDVTETDAFYSMPAKAQAIYFHLGMRADDEGFVASPKRSCGASERILNILESNGYIIQFKSGVIVVSDWKVNNFIRKDRFKQTIFQNELSQLKETTADRYIKKTTGEPVDNQMETSGQPDDNQTGTRMEPDRQPTGNQMETQYSIEENRVVESSRETAAPAAGTDVELAQLVQHFEQVIGIFPRSALDKLQRWREVFPVEIIQAAFDEAAENGVRKWRYIDGILKGWQADGVRTMGDVEARRESRKKPPEREREMLT